MEETLLFALVSPHLQTLALPSHGSPFMGTHRPPVIRPVSASDFIVAGSGHGFLAAPGSLRDAVGSALTPP